MWKVVVACTLALTGCDRLFPRDVEPADSSLEPDAEDLRPIACRYPGLVLCLNFEDPIALGADYSEVPKEVSVTAAASVPRQDMVANELALELADASIVALVDNDPFDLQAPLSIDLWVDYTKFTNTERVLFDNHFQYTVSLGAATNTVTCSFIVNDLLVFGSSNINPGAWRHVACTYDGTTAIAYVDGVPSPTSTVGTGTINPEPTAPKIGRSGLAGDRPFAGNIDNLRVWHRLLSPTEINNFAFGVQH